MGDLITLSLVDLPLIMAKKRISLSTSTSIKVIYSSSIAIKVSNIFIFLTFAERNDPVNFDGQVCPMRGKGILVIKKKKKIQLERDTLNVTRDTKFISENTPEVFFISQDAIVVVDVF